jgi:type VI secretion system secreted protein VgrG
VNHKSADKGRFLEASNWAGAGWGGQIIPRIGMEVMVTYLDGDLDRPVVTGVVPNPKRKVPYALSECVPYE